MCKRKDSIAAVTNAAHRLENACNGIDAISPELLQQPATLQFLPTTADADVIAAIAEQLKTTLH